MTDSDGDISDTGREYGIGRGRRRPSHYYGDNVRKLFVTVAIVTLITLPFFKDFIRAPIMYYITAMIFLCLVAGFTNPTHRWVIVMNVIISIYGILFFESEAINAHNFYDVQIWYFWTNQLLALLSMTSLYYAAKTERGAWFRRGIPHDLKM